MDVVFTTHHYHWLPQEARGQLHTAVRGAYPGILDTRTEVIEGQPTVIKVVRMRGGGGGGGRKDASSKRGDGGRASHDSKGKSGRWPASRPPHCRFVL